MRKEIPIIMAVILAFLLFFLNFRLVLFNEGFYKKEFEKFDIYEEIPDADQINSDVLSYFRSSDNLIKNDFFNENEKMHLFDVRLVIRNVLFLFYSLLAIFLVLVVLMRRIFSFKDFSFIFFFGGAFTFVISFFLWLIAKLNFSGFFTFFHKIFFPQGNWLFDPAVDKIILLYPSGFFYDMAVKIFLDSLYWALVLILIGVLIFVLRKKGRLV